MQMSQIQEIFTLMGGRVRMYRGNYNPTSDAVWLAAAVGDVPAQTVLDVGVGTGGAALCLHAHNPTARIMGIDVSEPRLAEMVHNATLNKMPLELDIADITTWKTDRTFDLVMTNPPYFKGTPAAHGAHHNADLGLWTRKCVARTRPRGTFCIIVDAAAVAQVIAAMHPTCGDINIFPLFGARPVAERAIIRGRIGTRGPTVLHTGISMNDSGVLRDGLTIDAALARVSEND